MSGMVDDGCPRKQKGKGSMTKAKSVGLLVAYPHAYVGVGSRKV